MSELQPTGQKQSLLCEVCVGVFDGIVSEKLDVVAQELADAVVSNNIATREC